MKPFISAEQNIAELTLRSILLAIILTVILAISNTFLALKLGILTSASIPAAIISMGILRLFKNATILENNAVQTAASAGEAVAGGIVYTIPALIIIEYWHEFDYLTNFFIAASGGVLGVLFSIPLRRVLVNEPILKFPEGRAIAEVLNSVILVALIAETCAVVRLCHCAELSVLSCDPPNDCTCVTLKEAISVVLKLLIWGFERT